MARTRILIVEDNSDVRRLYAIGLNQRGFEVKLAANGADAVERIHRGEKPDVILLDWMMPVMNGDDFLSRIAADGALGSIPVIVISGHPAPPPDRLVNNVQAWLTKPVTIDQLVSEIDRQRASPTG